MHDEMPVKSIFGVTFSACAPPGLLPREPPLLRGSPVGGPVWFSLPGRGFPPRAPPRVISPRSGGWDDVGEGRNQGRPSSCLRPCWGYHDYCPRPRGRGRSAEGAGGVGEIGERCMGRLPPSLRFSGCAPPGLLPREPPLLRGSPVGGPVWFSLPGRGFTPRTPPRAMSPTVRWMG